MEKIINPCKCEVHNRYIPTDRLGRPLSSKKYTHMTDAYAKIRYDGKRLSISGVIGPMRSGNCKGSAGQCVEEIRKGIPTKEWNREMLDKFCDIWERWHLNDLHAGCEHQRDFEKEPYEKHALEVCPVCGHKYGSDWQREELPQEVIDMIKSW